VNTGLEAEIAQFEAAVNGESKAVLGDVVKYLKDAVGATAKELIGITPVDTGHAKANWQVTLDVPAAGPVFAFDPSPVGVFATPTLSRAEAVLKGITLDTNVVYISNLLDYVSRIVEDGHSTQVATGEFSAALQRLESKFG